MKRTLRTIFALWVGGIIALGLWIIPSVFQSGVEKVLAGQVATHLFTIQAWMNGVIGGLIIILMMMVFSNQLFLAKSVFRTQNPSLKRLFWGTVFIFLTTGILALFIQPEMTTIQSEAKIANVPLEQFPRYQQFRYLHFGSSLIYFAQMLVGSIIVWFNQLGRLDD